MSRLLLARIEANADCLPPDFATHWQQLLGRDAALLDQRPVRLLQMESNGYCNLILGPVTHRIRAVLDFEEVTAGDPLFEWVSMAWYLGRRGISDHGERTCFLWKRFSLGHGPVEWRHPLEVLTAASGPVALRLIQQAHPDVALVDIGLPGMDGHEIALKARQLVAGNELFLLALSGYGNPEQKERALSSGFDGHLTKPAHIAEVDQLLRQRAKQG